MIAVIVRATLVRLGGWGAVWVTRSVCHAAREQTCACAGRQRVNDGERVGERAHSEDVQTLRNVPDNLVAVARGREEVVSPIANGTVHLLTDAADRADRAIRRDGAGAGKMQSAGESSR